MHILVLNINICLLGKTIVIDVKIIEILTFNENNYPQIVNI